MNLDTVKFKGRNRTRLEAIVRLLNDPALKKTAKTLSVEACNRPSPPQRDHDVWGGMTVKSYNMDTGPFHIVVKCDTAEYRFYNIDEPEQAIDFIKENLK